MSAIIRKIVTVVEETHLEMGKTISPPTRRAAAIAVIENPFAGKYVEDLSPLIAIGEELGELLSKRAVAAANSLSILVRTQLRVFNATSKRMLNSTYRSTIPFWKNA